MRGLARTTYTTLMQENIIRDWLQRRKITDTVISAFGIGEGSHFLLGNCITIPVHDANGLFLFNKYRRNPLSNEGPKYVYDSGAKVSLFGVDRISTEKEVLICEGELDALVAWSHLIPAVSSTGGALTFKTEWTEHFEEKSILLCFDNDEAGGMGMAKVFDIFPLAKILFLPDRPGIKDISDYVQNGGDLHFLLQSAVHFTTMESIIKHRNERIALWQSTYFHDAYIKNHSQPLKTERKHTTGGDVERAKAFPINQLLKFDTNRNTKCLWHNEKTGSLHWYPDSNKCYCFGCGKMADSIDIYRVIHTCSFGEAVRNLK